MYQLTVYSFADGNNDGIGDFIGLKDKLDYFVNLGIDTLYLSPIHPASSYHGYDVIDYTDVAPELGGLYKIRGIYKRSTFKRNKSCYWYGIKSYFIWTSLISTSACRK
ncbi:alpha-amylase family glycosyl hydrolase [Mycoplasmopsis felis]|nr:alpha-amylase family glycosyl hydrolase [Mycoplasmopsis felis]WAM01277.1 alpha-amylase family glycosyl hydrolase [Mycoplasmopsis felis]